MPFGAAYGAGKAGMMALMRTEAVELGARGIRVNAVACGTIRTPRSDEHAADVADTDAERDAIPLNRRGLPDDIAGAVLFLLSDLAAFVSGHVLVVDGASSVKPSYLDADNLPVFVHDDSLRSRLARDLSEFASRRSRTALRVRRAGRGRCPRRRRRSSAAPAAGDRRRRR